MADNYAKSLTEATARHKAAIAAAKQEGQNLGGNTPPERTDGATTTSPGNARGAT